MKEKKALALKYIQSKLDGKSFLTYEEIAEITGYHPKYILRLKKELSNGDFHLEHGNKNKEPINKMSKEEEEKIVNLYKRANASVRQFCRFYHSRSYSCIYNVLKKNGLLDKK
ncbi:MAG: hypothetical protein PHN72_06805 [Bacilli bacterium]|nr:hypothetical protein [Bacilli bacterium]